MKNNLAKKFPVALWFSTALIAAGVVGYLLSACHHVRLVRQLNQGGPLPSRLSRPRLC
jgi:hypothetical protein